MMYLMLMMQFTEGRVVQTCSFGNVKGYYVESKLILDSSF